VTRTEDGRVVARCEGGEMPLKEYLTVFVTENPEFLPARIAGGTGMTATQKGPGCPQRIGEYRADPSGYECGGDATSARGNRSRGVGDPSGQVGRDKDKRQGRKPVLTRRNELAAITSANVANAIVKLVAADALPVLVGNLVMGNLVNRNYEPVLAQAGDTVNVPIPPIMVANNIIEGGTVQTQNPNLGNAQIVLNTQVKRPSRSRT